jgi:hypothetical protein
MNRDAYIGIGFHRNVEAEEIENVILRFLKELGINQFLLSSAYPYFSFHETR